MYERWKQVPAAIRKPLALVVGSLLIFFGLIGLALPLLPGWVGFFLGFAVLASEFNSAKRIRDRVMSELKAFIRQPKDSLRRVGHFFKRKWREPWE